MRWAILTSICSNNEWAFIEYLFHHSLDVFCNTLEGLQFGKFNLRQSNISSNSHQRFFRFLFHVPSPVFFAFLMSLIRDAAKINAFLLMQKKPEKLKLLWCYELLFTPISRLLQKIDLETKHSWARILMNVNFQKEFDSLQAGAGMEWNLILASAHSWWKFDNYANLPIVEFHLINSQCEHVIFFALDIISIVCQ